MRSLVLCQACKRHVKVSEALCPFCSAAVLAPRAQATVRARGLPGGRAALFLAGTALAQGGAEEPEPDVLDNHNGAGAADAGAGARDGGKDSNELMGTPVYGVPIDQRDAGFAVPPYGIAIPIPEDAGVLDAGASCPQVGRLPAPVYGIAIDSGTRSDVCTDAGRDAGKDSGPLAVPVYGIAIDRDR